MSKGRDITNLLRTGGGAAVLETYQEWNEARLLDEPLGAYRVLKRIGSGGMSVVYRGERSDGEFERQVAIKVLEPALVSKRFMGRFLREKEILASLNHPNIAQLYDTGVTDTGFPFIVMELVEGQTLDRFIENTQLDQPGRIALFKSLVSAVVFAHQRMIIHRDLKPQNVLVSDDGVPKLLDFGIARLLEGQGEETTDGRSPFTPNYASPEQLLEGDVTTTSDIYQLGALLYFVLTGQSPHAGMDMAQRVEGAAQGRLPQPPSRAAGAATVSHELDAIALKCLRPDPEHRYPSASHLIADIERFEQGFPVEAMAGGATYRLGRFLHRNRTAVWVSIVGVLSIALVASIMQSQLSRVEQKAESLASSSDKLVHTLMGLFEGASPYDPQIASPAVNAVLQLAKQEIDESLADEPVLRSKLLTVMGNTERQLSRHREAEDHSRLALQLALGAADSTATAAAQSNLALLLIETGQLEEAESLLVAAEFSAPHVSDQLLVVDLLLHRALLSVFRGDPPNMRQYGQNAIDFLDANHLDDPMRRADAWYFVGRGLLDAEPLRARGYFEQADQLIVSFQGVGSLARARVLMKLGNTFQESGDYAQAEALYLEGLGIQQKLLGPDHVALSSGHGNVGLARRAQGDLEGAIAEYRAALSIAESALGSQGRGVGSLLLNLGNALEDAGQIDASLVAFRRALGIFEALDARGDIGKISNNYGISLYRIRRYEDAIPMLERALQLKTEAFGADSLTAARTRLSLVRVHLDARSTDFAKDNLPRALEIYQRTFGVDHQKLSYPYLVLGEYELASGDPVSAQKTLKQALVWRRQEYGDDGLRTVDPLRLLAVAQMATNDLADARANLVRAIEIQQAQPDQDPIEAFRLRLTQSRLRRLSGDVQGAEQSLQAAEALLTESPAYDRLREQIDDVRRTTLGT